ncbi:molybdopterin-dependent oxidoreductase [Thermopolyspora sp. NPDC052614]|uniref:molybdopterin-dependent oxidoreductase n=1 Tax=Thermopolyspora sp. NPDC052614 TaxID=3155682 RepID=UPI003429984A
MPTVHRTCPLCEAVCGLRITLDDDGRVTDVRGDPADPLSHGFICPKGASLGALDEDPDRLRAPMVREGGEWREVTWAEAFRAVERGLTGVVERHGRGTLGIYLGNPNVHTVAGTLYVPAVARALGTRNVFSAGTADQMPKHVSAGLMFGHPMTIPVPDVDRTEHLLILGANPLESNGSLWTAPDLPGRLKALRRRGGRLVVVDPRRTRTAALADEHVFIRPGTDAYLLFGIVHTLLAEDLVAPDVGTRLPVNGLEEVRALAADFPPETVAGVCGVPAARIVRLARDLAAAPRAAVYGRMGTSTAEFGTLAQWLIDVVNVLTGNLDRPGGAMFARPAAAVPRSGRPYRTGRWRSRVRDLPEVNGELPVATLADEIQTPGEGQIKALITIAGNPVLSTPHGDRLDDALGGLEFMVSVDPYVNETTRHAHVILPPPRVLQSPHYDFTLLNFAVRNYARYSPPALPLEPGRPAETEILARLALIAAGQGADADPAALDELLLDQTLRRAVQTPGSPVAGRDPAELRAELTGATGVELRLDAMVRFGPYGLSLEDLRRHPHGLDLGPLEPMLPDALTTASGRIELAPPEIVADVPRLRAALGREVPGLVLIGRRHLRSNNSWMHNIAPLVGGSNRCTLHINPQDARRLRLNGEAVVRSAAGELRVAVEPTDTIMPGVVSLPHGWGHAGSAQPVAAKHAGVNVNALTDETVVDVPSGNAVFNGVPVTVHPLTG